MRSCLIQFVIMVAVVFCLLWFGLPLGVSALATAALNATGFSGTDTKVEVSANPPFMLLTGHADTIRIRSSDARMGNLEAADVDVTLGSVELLSRDIGTVTGTLDGVRVAAPNGDPIAIEEVTLQGSATATTATATMTLAEAEALAEDAAEGPDRDSGQGHLQGPQRRDDHGRGQVAGRAAGDQQRLAAARAQQQHHAHRTLMAPGTANPLSVTSVSIGSAVVTLVGTIDIQNLLS